MLPLSLLKAAIGSPMLVELKGGDTYNGRLQSADAWMNMNLTDVICTSATGDRFWKLPACYIRGSAIKYLRLLPAVLEQAVVADEKEQQPYQGRGGRGEGGRGRGGRGSSGGRMGGRGRSSSGGRGEGGRGRGEGGRGRGGGGRSSGRGDGGRGRSGGRGGGGGGGRE